MSQPSASPLPAILRIATRQSPLALWQAEHIRRQLLALYPQMDVELVTFVTQGDRILDTPLAKIGGKGLFVKELEAALLDGRADLAVHSMKDVPMALPEGLALAVICEREDPSDAFVSVRFESLASLPHGAVVGTSSLRRQCQLRAIRPDLQIRDLRGNVGTRLKKLDAGEYDAIILASAGLRRLGLAERIRHALSYAVCLPAVGQGALGLECREQDTVVQALIRPLADAATDVCVRAERAFNQRLMGGCQVPIAGFAELDAMGQIHLEGRVGGVPQPGQPVVLLREQVTGPAAQAEILGRQLAESLLAQGAAEVLQGWESHSVTAAPPVDSAAGRAS